MGELDINQGSSRASYLKHLLNDIKALDLQLKTGKIESGVQRIGAEQEFSFVQSNFRPSNRAVELLKNINDPHFTTELATYNLEINLDPQSLSSDGLKKMRSQLEELLEKAQLEADKIDAKILLTGILPTIRHSELELAYLTPLPRYAALNKVMREVKGEDYHIKITGVDDFNLIHNNILIEACNTSFQIHLQTSPEEFVDQYNWAQLIAGPVLSACTNSPLLLEHELWMETRIALFQQSCDIRHNHNPIRKKEPRVTFGSSWVRNSINDIFKDHVSKYPHLLAKDIEDDSLEQLDNNVTPKLKALCLHNGTVYLWNRPCYGLTNGVPHIRIENRYIPSGPSIIDEVANLSFWIGLMNNMPVKAKDIWNNVDFEDANYNFTKAARYGLNTQLTWFGENVSASELLLKELIPLATAGLEKAKIDPEDISLYMGIIEERVRSGKTGAAWTIRTYRNYKKTLSDTEASIAVTKAMYENQITGKPVHQWPTYKEQKKQHVGNYERVDEIMSTKLITGFEDDLVSLAKNVMDWNKIHHMPIENNKAKLVGLLTLSRVTKELSRDKESNLVVKEIMRTDIHTIGPEDTIKTAVQRMKTTQSNCLPVIHENELVGILTENDIIRIQDKLSPDVFN